MNDWILRIPWPGIHAERSEPLLTREWLVTNGLGGYASGTIAGVASRRYHGLLIAALPNPYGRRVMLNHLSELVRLANGTSAWLGGEERPDGKLHVPGSAYLTEFRLDNGLPVWRYAVDSTTIEKSILLVHGQNTVHIEYRLIDGPGPVRLKLRPSLHFRPHEAPVSAAPDGPYVVHVTEHRYEVECGETPPLRMFLHGERTAFTVECAELGEFLYRMEEARGYDSLGGLWTPGYFRADLSAEHGATLIASTEPWSIIGAVTPTEARAAELERRSRLLASADAKLRDCAVQDLILAADQFIITPIGRTDDAARGQAAGDEVRSVIAGYHWFTDWGRDTMISLEGLTLTTGRYFEAGCILRTFAYYIRDGLLPNLFPEGERLGLYHTADATLWYFHAIDRYVSNTGDRETLRLLLPKLHDIVAHHVRGTQFGIGVNPADGLLRQGAPGYQLTWMDAKVGDWVVTPRRGKAVEINALWYNALMLLEKWTAEEAFAASHTPAELAAMADRAAQSFNARFWNPSTGHLFDVIDGEEGDDPACRPNQILALSLPHPVLAPERWPAVLDVVRGQLLTPVGLRSLAPGHPDYKTRYDGDLRSRDAAYHQGTVWAWLIGPFIDAWLRVHPGDVERAREFLRGFVPHLTEAGIGTISEVFDAEPPFTPRGCVAQAWSVAEVLRAWVKTAPPG